MRKYLFLQGPLGPFFAQLSSYLRKHTECDTYKIGFNGGDEFYAEKHNYVGFNGVHSDFEAFVADFIQEHKITDILVYGDCRYYHKIARRVSLKLNTNFWAFEEGYFRPNFVTFEKEGVNGHSRLTTLDVMADHVNASINRGRKADSKPGSHFANIALYAILYYWSKTFLHYKYPNYLHHRPWLIVEEGMNWMISGIRKLVYKATQRKLMQRLTGELKKKYYLAPLQVSIDSQILFHSPFDSVEEFIGVVIESFSEHAPKDSYLVFKHHPQDRGFTNYHNYIKKLSYAFDVNGRVLYCHDLHLPTLLHNAKGTVTINSTVGISSLIHGIPTKALGSAIFNLDKITSQNSLDEFWNDPSAPDKEYFQRFANVVLDRTQVVGSFYRKPEDMFVNISERLATSVKVSPT